MPKLGRNKSKWAKNRDVYLNGTPLGYSAAVRVRYEKELRTLVQKMTYRTRKDLIQLFESRLAQEYFTMDASISSNAKILLNELKRRFVTLFSQKSIDLASNMVHLSQKRSQSEIKASLQQLTGELSIKTNFIPSEVREVSKAAIAENVNLIKSIPQEYFTQISGAVMRSITSGQGVKSLMNHFKKYDKMSDRKAKNIALDQTRKAYNSINAARLSAAGYQEFKWLHSGGGLHPRKSHVAMNGKIFKLDDLPVINKEQVDAGYSAPERGLPAQAPNCGCTMQPVYKMPSE